VSTFPFRVLAGQFQKFRDRAVELVLVAVGVAQIVADARFLRVEALGGAILRNRVFQPPLIMQDYAQVAVRFPKVRLQAEGAAVSDGSTAQIALSAQRDSHVVINVSVGGLTNQRLLKSIESRIVASGGVQG